MVSRFARAKLLTFDNPSVDDNPPGVSTHRSVAYRIARERERESENGERERDRACVMRENRNTGRR